MKTPGFAPVTPAKPELIQAAVCDGRRMGLATPYAPSLSRAMRELGACWSPQRRMWVLELDHMRDVLAGLAERQAWWPGLSLGGARETALAAWRQPCPDYFTALLDVQVMPLQGGGHAVSAGFDVLVVRVLRSLGGRFHKPAGAWEIRGATDRQILQALRDGAGLAEEYVFVHEGDVVLEDLAASSKSELPLRVEAPSRPEGDGASAAKRADAGGFLSTHGTPLQVLPVDEAALAAAARACGLRVYQVAGVRHLLSLSAALLADDMGLGKTRQAVVAARLAAGDGTVLVTCPASLTINWEREIRAVYPGARVATVGVKASAAIAGSDWIIANYERLAGLVRDVTRRIEVMVVDEAHYLKEPQAGRTRNAFLLSQRIARRFLLTGTPVLNRELELHALLRLSGHPLGRLELKEFRHLYAGSAERREDLARQLSQWLLRRGKEVLTDLGTKTQQVVYVQAADDLAGYRAIMADGELQAMPKITKLRQHLELLKLEYLVESLQGLPADAKALVFCEYMDTVQALKQALESAGVGCVSLVGADPPKRRMAAVDAFQEDPRVRVFIGTTMAAGVGITLTAANYVFFASLPWTPALKRQAEDRAYRSGQRRDVLVIVPVVAHTIEEQIVKLLDSKRDIELALVESNRTSISA